VPFRISRQVVALAALLLVAVAAVPTAAPANAAVCISTATATRLGLPLGSPLRDVPRTLVLCMTGGEQTRLAVRTFVSAACRGEWKATNFAVRYGGGDYTTFRDCLAQKTVRATAQLARATHARVCLPEPETAPRAWSPPRGRAFGVWIVEGRC
jgi:hypothetical protein